MELTATNVDVVFKDCLFREEELVSGTPEHVAVKGIMSQFGFHPKRLEGHQEDVKGLLAQLPDSFMASKGGGHSFLNACMTKTGSHWGEHVNMEQLFALGVGLKLARRMSLPGMTDAQMPGGMPYFVVEDVLGPERPVDKLIPEAKRREAITGATCALSPLGCGGPASQFKDDLSRREYQISGLCQKCQDEVFAEPKD